MTRRMGVWRGMARCCACAWNARRRAPRGPAGRREEINRAAKLLGFARSDYINKSYGALFMEERGLAGRASHKEPVPFSGVPDMVFGSARGPREGRTGSGAGRTGSEES